MCNETRSLRKWMVKMLFIRNVFLHWILYAADTSGKELVTMQMKDNIHTTTDGGKKWIFPEKCINDCREVAWTDIYLNNEHLIKFTIRGPSTGYVAMAISSERNFGDNAANLCSRSESESSHIQINTGYLSDSHAPVIEDSLSSQFDGSASVSNNHLSCTFVTSFNVTRMLPNGLMSWNLALNKYHLLYAEGGVTSSGELLKQTFTQSTQDKVSFADTVAYHEQTDLFISNPIQNTGLSVPVNEKDEIIAVPHGEGGKWIVPNGDCHDTIGCTSIQWGHLTHAGETVMQFTIVGSGVGWVGMAISDDTKIGNDDDFYYCSRSCPQSDQVSITSAFMSGNEALSAMKPIAPDRVYLALIDKNTMVCSFLRPINVTKTIDGNPRTWDLSQENFNLVYVEGPVNSNGSLQMHTFKEHTNGKFHFLNNDNYKSFFPEGSDESEEIGSELPYLNKDFHMEDLKNTPTGGGIWDIFPDCQNNCPSLKWEPVFEEGEIMVRFTISGAGPEFIGFTISKEFWHGAGDCYYCSRINRKNKEVSVISSECSFDSSPNHINLLSGETNATRDHIECSFIRPLSVTKNINGYSTIYDISANRFSLSYVEGSLDDHMEISNASIKKENYTPFAADLVNLTAFRNHISTLQQYLTTTTIAMPIFARPPSKDRTINNPNIENNALSASDFFDLLLGNQKSSSQAYISTTKITSTEKIPSSSTEKRLDNNRKFRNSNSGNHISFASHFFNLISSQNDKTMIQDYITTTTTATTTTTTSLDETSDLANKKVVSTPFRKVLVNAISFRNNISTSKQYLTTTTTAVTLPSSARTQSKGKDTHSLNGEIKPSSASDSSHVKLQNQKSTQQAYSSTIKTTSLEETKSSTEKQWGNDRDISDSNVEEHKFFAPDSFTSATSQNHKATTKDSERIKSTTTLDTEKQRNEKKNTNILHLLNLKNTRNFKPTSKQYSTKITGCSPSGAVLISNCFLCQSLCFVAIVMQLLYLFYE